MRDPCSGLRSREGASERHPCEHAFVSIKGSSYARFQRALDSGNLSAVRMAALELPFIELADALAICLLMRRQDDPGFERAAVRLLARLALERPSITLPQLRDAATALMDLLSPHAQATVAALCGSPKR